ncbi:MAG: NupC/NupG family nucleoside CNT transporter [Candidatus Marinimicrobia bacterium]|nr:NupC/NupG family nucleoside CNT transporter [Candidatus Neomarinimicrobiota bacterium]|tara:strand:+ start:2422 stop:3645 length:1224 start_codon:yes stop_codon:yes gene_type:complete
MFKYIGIIGILVLLGLAFMLSNNKKAIKIEMVLWGLGLQIFFGLIILKIPFIKSQFFFIDKIFKTLISFSDKGSDFLFQSFIPGVGYHEAMINFAFRALPVVIFFSSLISVAYYLGIIQLIVKWFAKIMEKSMKTSGAETLSISANVFVGQTEAPILIRPYINNMTKSELMAVMTGGFATVAGSVLALYVLWLEKIPGIAGHMLAASIMSAPAALVIAKIIYPETKQTKSINKLNLNITNSSDNVMEALSRGATDGLKLAANIGAMLIAFISVLSMINYSLNYIFHINLQEIMGYIFSPLAWTMGIPWKEANIVGRLMGEKIVLTELIAYGSLGELINNNMISERSAIISSYALCGFANFGSIGIQIGGIGAMAPQKRKSLSQIALKAMIGGALASWLTATIAGILI